MIHLRLCLVLGLFIANVWMNSAIGQDESNSRSGSKGVRGLVAVDVEDIRSRTATTGAPASCSTNEESNDSEPDPRSNIVLGASSDTLVSLESKAPVRVRKSLRETLAPQSVRRKPSTAASSVSPSSKDVAQADYESVDHLTTGTSTDQNWTPEGESLPSIAVTSFESKPCQSCRKTDCGGACSQIPTNPLFQPWWAHRTSVFADYFLLRPSNTDVVYAAEQTDTTGTALGTGPMGIVGFDTSSGYRAGFSLRNTDTTSFVVSFTNWESNTQGRLDRNGSSVINSRVLHPSTSTVGVDSLSATALASMDYQLIDAFYYHKLFCTDTTIFNWSAGFRFGEMNQSLIAQQDISPATGTVNATSDVDFSGLGFLMGIDAQRRSTKTGLLCFSRGLASFLGGEWSGSYTQSDQMSGLVTANQFDDYRLTPVLEAELGIGWQNDRGNFRATVGYIATCWCDSLTTRDYIQSVRTGQFEGLDESIGFTGLTSRLELRY